MATTIRETTGTRDNGAAKRTVGFDPLTAHDRAMLQRLQALGEETRFQVIRLLAGGERCVCEIQDRLDAAQSRLSFHSRKLKDAGLVADRRDGRWVHYSLVPEALEELRAFLERAGSAGSWLPVLGGCAPGPEGDGSGSCCD